MAINWTPDALIPLCDSQVVLIHPGLTSLIAHIRVGRMQVALEAKSTVLPAVGRLLGHDSQDSVSVSSQIMQYTVLKHSFSYEQMLIQKQYHFKETPFGPFKVTFLGIFRKNIIFCIFFHIPLALKSFLKKTSLDCALVLVCGDGICEEEELCSTCPADCGECPMASQTKLAIGLTLSLLCLCFTLTAVVRQRQSQQMPGYHYCYC